MVQFTFLRVWKCLAMVGVFALAAASLSAQTSTLTNQSILDLVKAGLGKSIIITTINNASADFDVSADGLIALKTAKIDDDIIAAMVTKASGGSVVAGTNAAAPVGNVELLNHPHYNNQPLDKVTGSVSTKARALGYGGANSQYEVDGEQAKLRISGGGEVAFIVNTGGAAPELALYRAEGKKGKRIVVLAKVRMLSGAQTGGGSLSISTSALGNGVYKIIPSDTLDAGEYFFITRGVGTSASVDDAFAFGIDK